MATRARFVTPGLAHVAGESGRPLLDMTCGEAFERSERTRPLQTCVVDHEQRVKLSYAEVGRRSRAFALALRGLGMRDGDRVGVWLANRWEWVVTQVACFFEGIILVNVNPAYRASELHYAAKLVGLRALVLQPVLKHSDYYAILTEAGNIPSLEFIIEVGNAVRKSSYSFNAMWQGELHQAFSAKVLVKSVDACGIQFTSGTTGHPKGTVLNHYGTLNNARSFSERLGMTANDLVVCAPPLYHCFGCVLGTLAVLYRGATIVLASESFSAEACLDSIQLYGATIQYGVPTMLLEIHNLYSSKKGKWNVATLRAGAMGGSPCPPELMRKCIADLGMRDIACVYGMTETSPISFMSDASDPEDLRCTTVGRILEHVECKVVDQTTRKTLPVGAVGELCTKGYLVMLGYWQQPDKTKEAIQDGWMLTGDLASIDSHGYCRIVGRSKDMIIRGGENIFPAEATNLSFSSFSRRADKKALVVHRWRTT
jgi:fatty-acyl-CoA synthase